MTVDSTDIGTKYKTQIPTLQSDADIQAALTLYHYGAAAEPGTLIADSVAGHLDALESTKVNKAASALPTGSVSGNNLDNVFVTGFYTQTKTGAENGSNYPTLSGVKYGGELSVTSDGGVIYQDYHMTNGANINEKFWRAKFAGSWTSWASASQVGHHHNDAYLLRSDYTLPSGQTGVLGQAQITGAAKSVVVNQLNTNAVVTTDSAGDISSSSTVSTTELGYLDGVTSGIQSQFTTITGTLIPAKPTIVNGKNATGTQLTGTRQFVIARPNPSNTAVPDATVTGTEGDIWFW